ncbi:hypothetical protein [Pedobacter sp. UBA5917]|jgi:hypothetical protein|uniref:hypothetical protein n=1 Tax=Pedobacter sp. UBA5917 TaxID=1947061 RepID=UPI0025D1BAD4|nr:hypothetical protein [Pedobacter sp. UBA5917]
MLKYATYILTFLILTGCYRKSENKNPDKKSLPQDTSSIAVLTYQNTNKKTKFPKNIKLSKSDFLIIEQQLSKCIAQHNREMKNRFKTDSKFFFINISDYKRQYIASIDAQGNRKVWVNCFCRTGRLDWKTQEISVSDGGKCFFNLMIDLDKKTYYQLIVNGNA